MALQLASPQGQILTFNESALGQGLLVTLERRYLHGVPYLGLRPVEPDPNLLANTRFLKVAQVAHSADLQRSLHPLNMQNVISSFRDGSHSLVYVVRGKGGRTTVYLGLYKFIPQSPAHTADYIEILSSALHGNYPGIRLTPLEPRQISTENRTNQDATQLDGLPRQITIIDPTHPLYGRTFPLERSTSPRGKTQLIILLPNGLRRSVPRLATDFDPPAPAINPRELPFISIRTILPVAGFVQSLLHAAEEVDEGRSGCLSGTSREPGGNVPNGAPGHEPVGPTGTCSTETIGSSISRDDSAHSGKSLSGGELR